MYNSIVLYYYIIIIIILFFVDEMHVKYTFSISCMKRVQDCYRGTFGFGQFLKRLIRINVGGVYAPWSFWKTWEWQGSLLLILGKYQHTHPAHTQMVDIYSPFIRLEQAKCYLLELTAGVCMWGCMCTCVCPQFVPVNEQKYSHLQILFS